MTRREAHLQKALESIRDMPSDDPWWFCFAVETARNALDHQPSNRRQKAGAAILLVAFVAILIVKGV